MDESIFQPLQQYVLPHWPFLFMSFSLGIIGQFFKRKVWTMERAKKKGGIWAIMHQTLGIHAPILGACAGALGAPVSPGVVGPIARALYHFVAGAMASWTVAAFKHFMTSRGIVIADSLTPPPTTPSLMPDADDKRPTLPDPPPPVGKS
jgi:hypothetical protein